MRSAQSKDCWRVARSRAVNPRNRIMPYLMQMVIGTRCGFIQLTLKRNYKAASERLGLDLVNDPDRNGGRASRRHSRAGDARRGTEVGSIVLDINGSKEDWIDARNNVNPGSPNKPITAATPKNSQVSPRGPMMPISLEAQRKCVTDWLPISSPRHMPGGNRCACAPDNEGV